MLRTGLILLVLGFVSAALVGCHAEADVGHDASFIQAVR